MTTIILTVQVNNKGNLQAKDKIHHMQQTTIIDPPNLIHSLRNSTKTFSSYSLTPIFYIFFLFEFILTSHKIAYQLDVI